MTDEAFRQFIRALPAEMERNHQDEHVLDVDESGSRARIPLSGDSWFSIDREHLDVVGGTPADIAAAVYAAYHADLAAGQG